VRANLSDGRIRRGIGSAEQFAIRDRKRSEQARSMSGSTCHRVVVPPDRDSVPLRSGHGEFLRTPNLGRPDTRSQHPPPRIFLHRRRDDLGGKKPFSVGTGTSMLLPFRTNGISNVRAEPVFPASLCRPHFSGYFLTQLTCRCANSVYIGEPNIAR